MNRHYGTKQMNVEKTSQTIKSWSDSPWEKYPKERIESAIHCWQIMLELDGK